MNNVWSLSTKLFSTLLSSSLHILILLFLIVDLGHTTTITSQIYVIHNNETHNKNTATQNKKVILFLRKNKSNAAPSKQTAKTTIHNVNHSKKESALSLKSPINWTAPVKQLFDLKKATAKIQQKQIIPQHKNISLMDIARSFLAQDYIKKNGINNDHPSNEQIKRERYASKIKKCLYGSFNINKHKLSFNVPIKAPIKMYLEFLPNGLLKDVKLIEPTGIPELDSFALKICSDASKSFPPVPKFFGNTNCKAITFLTLYPAQKKGHIEVKLL